MNWDFTSRLASVAITALLVVLVSDHNLWVALVIGFGFAHYLLSFYYARAGIRSTLSNPLMILPVVSLSTLFAVVYFLDFPLEIYFGLHHACNEGYLKRVSSGNARHQDYHLAATRTLFHLSAYFILLRHDAMVAQLPETFLWAFLAVASLLFFAQARTQASKTADGWQGVFKGLGIEWMVLVLIGLSFFFKFTFLQVVMYHFLLWTFVPIRAIKAQGSSALAEYGLLTVGSLGIFLMLTTTQLFSSIATLSFMYSQFIFWSYVHITTSFMLSSAHPQWIVNLFRPAARET